jgi:hypothetical protein
VESHQPDWEAGEDSYRSHDHLSDEQGSNNQGEQPDLQRALLAPEAKVGDIQYQQSDDTRNKTMAHMDGGRHLLREQLALTQRPGDTGSSSAAARHNGTAEYQEVNPHCRNYRQQGKPIGAPSLGSVGAKEQRTPKGHYR